MNEKTMKAMFSNKSDLWKTPKDMYDLFIKNGYFDPCPSNPRFNGLEIKWSDKNFVNPPYSEIEKWVDKAIYEVYNNQSIVFLLVPSRTDTKWFHKLLNTNDISVTLTFIKGRLKFGESKNTATFPSVIIRISKTHQTEFGRKCYSGNKRGLIS